MLTTLVRDAGAQKADYQCFCLSYLREMPLFLCILIQSYWMMKCQLNSSACVMCEKSKDTLLQVLREKNKQTKKTFSKSFECNQATGRHCVLLS